jgi:hypothetical protein
MPVEIKELVIRAVVADTVEPVESSDRSHGGAVQGGREVIRSESFPTQTEEGLDQRAVVEECVRQVLSILRRSRER